MVGGLLDGLDHNQKLEQMYSYVVGSPIFLRLKGCSLSFMSVYQRKFTNFFPSTQVPDVGAICRLHRSRRQAMDWPFLELAQNLPWDPKGQKSGKYKMKLRCEVFYLSHVLFIVFQNEVLSLQWKSFFKRLCGLPIS